MNEVTFEKKEKYCILPIHSFKVFLTVVDVNTRLKEKWNFNMAIFKKWFGMTFRPFILDAINLQICHANAFPTKSLYT